MGGHGVLVAERYRLGTVTQVTDAGRVWDAIDELTGQDVWVEELTTGPDVPPVVSSAAEHQAHQAAGFAHPHVAVVMGAGLTPDAVYVVTRRYDALPVRQVVHASGPLPVPEVVRIGQQLLDVLAAASTAGLAHRGPNPDVVLLSTIGEVVFAAFPAAFRGPVTGYRRWIYQAPERLHLAAHHGPDGFVQADRAAVERADLFELAATLYFAVEAVAPYDLADLAGPDLACRRPTRAGPLGELLVAMLSVNPADRPEQAAIRAGLANLSGYGLAAMPVEASPAQAEQPAPVAAPAARPPPAPGQAARTAQPVHPPAQMMAPPDRAVRDAGPVKGDQRSGPRWWRRAGKQELPAAPPILAPPAAGRGRVPVIPPATGRGEPPEVWQTRMVDALPTGLTDALLAELAAPPLPRHVNLYVARRGYSEPVTSTLDTDARYHALLSIGPKRDDSIVGNADDYAFPVEQLPRSDEGWWLDVVASGIGVTCDSRPQVLFLPRVGDAYVCPCRPGGAHTCPPELRVALLPVEFTTGSTPGQASLQVVIYHGPAAIQALRIMLAVGAAGPAPSAEVTFSVNRNLADLDRHTDRSASIVSSTPLAGHHQLQLNDGQGLVVSFDLVEAQAMTAARELRRQLFEISLVRVGEVWTSRYDQHLAKPAADLVADLRSLATIGRETLTAIIPDPAARRQLRSSITRQAAQTGQPALIQLARAANTRVALPWQLLYELPLTSSPQICPSVTRFGPGGTAGPGGAAESPPATCPYAAQHDPRRGVLCPYGFWGLAHLLEVPPWNLTADPAIITGDQPPPAMLIALNSSLAGPVWEAHRATLNRISGRPDLPVVTGSVSMRSSAGDGLDVLYVLCHGTSRARASGGAPQPVLELSQTDLITPTDVGDWPELSPAVHWESRRPLVILNGCHTGEVLPDTLTEFVTAFTASLGAAGVVATEISMDRDLACAAMELFLARLWAGQSVAEAVRAMRWELLARGNVMGLGYTPYCDAHLRLPRATASSTQT